MNDHKKINAILIFSIILFIVVSLFVISIVRKTSKETSEFASEMKQIETQSEVDRVEAIEKEINATDSAPFDQELQNTDYELDQNY